MNVLIIDDNKDITDAVSLFIENQGYSCIISNNGKEGCDLAQKENFDLILLDIAMPDFSGYDVLDTLKKTLNFDMKKIVVITASSIGDSSTDEIELKYGISKIMKKPISLDSLRDIFAKFT